MSKVGEEGVARRPFGDCGLGGVEREREEKTLNFYENSRENQPSSRIQMTRVWIVMERDERERNEGGKIL